MGGQAVLRGARIKIATDGEVWGLVELEFKDGHTRTYAQGLPQHALPDPPGWSALSELTGVSAADVLTSWAEDNIRNPAAEVAFAQLRGHIGETFFVREVAGVAGQSVAVELIPPAAVDPTIADGLHRDQEGPGSDALVPATRAAFAGVTVHSSGLALEVHAENARPLLVRIPNHEHPDPPEFFPFETIFGVSAARVLGGWQPHPSGVPSNPAVQVLLEQANQLGTALQTLAVDANGAIDGERLRADGVRLLYANGGKPNIFLGRDPQVTVQQCWSVLRDLLGGHLLRYNAEVGKSSGVPCVVRSIDGRQHLEILSTPEKMRGVLITFARFTAQLVPKNAPNKHPTFVEPPRAVCEQMVLFPDTTVPMVDALVRTPTMRADGTVLATEGYDARTRTWYAPEVQIEPVSDNPTSLEVRRALSNILTPFSEFPYVEHSGAQAAVVACLLDQIVRPLIRGPRPIFAFDAPAVAGPGSGKTLLASAVCAVLTGHAEITPFPDDPRELPKLITGKLLAQDSVVVFDNLEGTVRHKDLAAVATTTVWTHRILGKQEIARMPQTATWCLTLNGAEFSRDLARRTVVIRLDTRQANAYTRKGFKIRDLIPWCVQHRAEVIRACLVLARAWDRAGRPSDPDLVIGSFESWAAVVGGILHYAGLRGLPLAVQDARRRDVSADEHQEFITAWADRFGHQPVNAAQLTMLAAELGLYAKILERSRSLNWQARYMSEQLRRLCDQEIGGHVIERSDKMQDHMWYYRLRPQSTPTASVIDIGTGERLA